MKKLTILIVLLIVFAGFLSAQELPKITIVNNTGYPVYGLWLEPISNIWDEWGLLYFGVNEFNIISPGRSIEVTLPLPLNAVNTYNIVLIDLDDDTYTKENVQITANARIVFVFDDIDW